MITNKPTKIQFDTASNPYGFEAPLIDALLRIVGNFVNHSIGVQFLVANQLLKNKQKSVTNTFTENFNKLTFDICDRTNIIFCC